jgi:hypothetical protein
LEAAPCVFGPPLNVYVNHGFLSFLSMNCHRRIFLAMAEVAGLDSLLQDRLPTRAAL